MKYNRSLLNLQLTKSLKMRRILMKILYMMLITFNNKMEIQMNLTRKKMINIREQEMNYNLKIKKINKLKAFKQIKVLNQTKNL